MSNSTTSIVSLFYYSEQNLPDPSLNKNLQAAKADTTRQLILKRHPGLSRFSLTLSWAIGLLLVISQLAQAQVTGTVFQDYDGNGVKGTYEGGVAGVTVTAYFNATVATAVSTSAGAYSFPASGANSIPSGAKARLEFGTLPTGNFSGPFSAATAGNGTSVQFVTAGAAATAINFGINLPGQYCQTIPVLYTPCFVSGQPTTGSNAGAQYSIVGVNYDGSGSVTHPALASDVGSVWGLAYQQQTKQLFSATMLKRHVGLGPLGIGGIYLTTIATSTTRQFANLQGLNGIQLASPSDLTALSSRGLPNTSTTSSVDATAFGQVGKIGFGGLALSANQDTLWAINLYQKTLIAIHVGSNPTSTTITAADVQSYAIPNPGCNLGTYRPWAVTFHNGLLYIGVVCSAENGGAASDIKAHVYTFNPATKTFSAVPIFSITNMAYTKGAIHTGDAALGANWERWSDLWADVNIGTDISGGNGTGYRAALPQPILSGITFDDDGSMVLAFDDRGGHQLGVVQQGIGTPTANRYSGYIGGDILRAAVTGANSYTLESNGSSGGRTGSGVGDTQGPGGGEFFAADTYPDAAPLTHTETSMGAAVIIPGRGELTNMQMDPTDVWTGGIVWMNTLNGSNVRRFEIYQTKDGSGTVLNGSGGKANGLGAIAPACNIAPIEIGNRIWNDADRDGIQDPSETGIPGVTVTLYKSNTLIATAVTNTDGEYYFSSDVTGTNTTAAIYSLTGLTPGSTVQLRISQTQAALSSFSLSPADQGTNDAIDNDFAPSAVGSTTAVANVTLGTSGKNVHTFDAGVYVCPTITFSAPSSATTTVCANTTLTFSISTTAVAPDSIRFVYFNSPLTNATDAYTATSGTVMGTVSSGTATGTKTISIPNFLLPDNVGSTTKTIYVYAILISSIGSCQPVAQRIIILNPRPTVTITGNTVVCQGSPAVLTANVPAADATVQWFLNSGTAVVGTTNPFTTAAISTTTTYRVRATASSCVSADASVIITPVVCTSCTASATTVGGVVYRDFNGDGTKVSGEPGLSTITVTIFRCDANNQSTQVATMPTDINGAYSFTGLTAGTTYRVEFSNLPSGYESTYRGTQNGTTVQFTQPGSCSISLGLNQPTDYCQANPRILTTCYVNGDNNATTPVDALVSWNYNDAGTTTTNDKTIANKANIGSGWGVAYSRTRKMVYTAAFLKRHVGVGPGGLGAIYVSNPNATSANATVFITIPNAGTIATNSVRGLAAPSVQNADPTAFSLVGAVGLGDMDISDDEKYLYVTNLADKKIYVIDITAQSIVTSVAVPDPGCTGGLARPFALGYNNGKLYAGVTCDASTSNSRTDLKAFVYVMDPITYTFSNTPVLQTNLNYRRTPAWNESYYVNNGETDVTEHSRYWYPWVNAYSTAALSAVHIVGTPAHETVSHPTPLLSDLEFDVDGSLILGFIDRTSHQIGTANYQPTGNATNDLEEGDISGGDILRATPSGSGWAIEPLNYTTAGTPQEFYGGEFYSTNHYETAQGGLLLVPGKGEVVTISLDPEAFYTGGVIKLSNTTGTKNSDFQVYDGNLPFFGKATGLGDVQALCDLAPIQIGNRVWRDDNKNGIQDPCEPAIPGAVVTLYDATKTTAYASVTTNAAGEYYFSSTTITTGTSTSSVATTALTYNSNYALVITSLGTSTVVTGLSLTSVSPVTPGENSTANSGTTPINNDAMVMNGKPTIMLTTGGPGTTNHTYDFGLAVVPCSLSLVATPGVCLSATNQYTVTGTVTLIATPASNLTITDGLVSTAISVSAGQTSATYSLSGLNSGTGLHTVTLISSATACGTVSTTYTAPVSCTAAPVLAVVVTPGTCSTATNQYAVSGTISLTASVTGSLTITNGTSTTTVSVTAGQASASFNLAGLTSGTGSHTVTVSGAGYSPASTTYTAPASCTIGVALIVTPGVCQSATNQYSIAGTLSLTNAVAGSATITDGAVTTTVSVSAGATSVPYSLTGLASGTGSHTVTVSYASKTNSVTYTAPLSCTVAPCGLAMVVTPGLCQSATNAYILSGTITATNVPTSGTLTISSAAFSPRTILLPAGNPSGTFSYSGLVSNGQTYTVTASYSDAACSPVSQTYTAPVSCSVAPVCSLSATATAGICATATNTYSATVTVTLANAPAGTLTISVPGTTPISQTLAANTGQFTAIINNLPSDGASHTATISLPGCTTTTATFTAPVSCSVAPICSLTATATPGLCQTATNTFTNVVVVKLTNSTTGVLTVTDGPASLTFATTGSSTSFTATFASITSNGASHTVTASLPGCSTTTTTYTAPTSCSVAPICSLTATATAGLCATATNTYSSTVVVQLTNPTAGVLTVTDGPQSATLAVRASGSATFIVEFPGLTSDGSTHTVTASLPGCSTTTTTYASPVSCSVTPICSVSAVVTVGLCATATNAYSITAVVTVKNPTAGGTLTVSTGTQTVTFSTTANSQNTFTTTFNGLISDGASHTVTASLPGCSTTNAGYTAPVSCSIAPVCSISAVATTGQCSTATNTFSNTVAITLTNPTAGTLTVTDGARSVTIAVPATLGTVTTQAIFNGIPSDAASHTVVASLPGCSTTTITYTAPASCTIALARLGDFVFADNNHNGVQDGGDTPIPGVVVTLVSNGTVVATTTTNTSGLYSFTGLTPGVPYSVSFTTPSGYTATTPLSGTDTTKDSNPVNGITASVTLAPGENNPTIDAGFILPTGSIGDFVWKDNNNNGIQDKNEPGVAGIKVELFTVVGGVTSTSAAQTTVTNANGYYLFSQLPLGDYTVKFTQIPTECQITGLINAGTDDTKDSDVDSSTHFSPVVHINPLGTGIAKDNPTIDLGLQRRVYDPIGYIYCYRDGTILKGGTIKVTGPGSITITHDGSKGYYQFFTDGTPGSYTLTYSNPNAYGIATAIRPPAAPALDPTGLDGSAQDKDGGKLDGWVQVGTKANADTTALPDFSSAQNPYYLVFNVTGGDPYVSDNNLPIECTPPATNLAINKLVNKSKAKIGDVLTYTVVLTNTGTTTATNVVVTDSSTTGLKYVTNSATAPAGTAFTHGTPVSFWTVSSISAGQSLSLTFQAIADSSGILYNRASIPGDTATVCTSVPFIACTGDTYLFRLTAAPGRSSYRWFRDNVEITGQTTNILNVTAPGTYSLAIDNVTGKCPDFSCCPFIVEEDTLPTFRATAVPVTCTGSTTLANGEIVLSGFNAAYTYQYSAGPNFNEAASLSGLAKTIPANGVIVNTLNNPTTAQSYTIRVYNASGCYTDVTVMLLPTVCGCPENVCVPFVIRQTRGPRRLGNPQ